MKSIAIDFGTERTKLAYWDETQQQARMMFFQGDKEYLPSLFYLGKAPGRLLYGFQAQEMIDHDPAGIVDVLKRNLQRTVISRNGQRVAPTDLLVLLLSALRKRAIEELPLSSGSAIDRVVLTFPAKEYGPQYKKILESAAKEAGFVAVELVPEPIAAARAWLEAVGGDDENILVIDCGGGTVDWAFLRHSNGNFELVENCLPDGNGLLGGRDIEEDIFETIKANLEEEGRDEDACLFTAQRVKFLAKLRGAKELFHTTNHIEDISIEGRTLGLNSEMLRQIANDRFVEQAWQGFDEYLKKVVSALNGKRPKILLVGGSARLQGFRDTISERSGCDVVWWERSEYATALGAISKPRAERTYGPVPCLPEPRKDMAESIEAIQAQWGEFAQALAKVAISETSYALLVLYAKACGKIEEAQSKAQSDDRFRLILEAALSISAIDFSTMPSQAALAARNILTRELDRIREHEESFGLVLSKKMIRNVAGEVSNGIEVALGRMLKSTAAIAAETRRMESISPELGNWLNTHGREWGGALAGGMGMAWILAPLGPPGWLLGAIGGWLGSWLGGSRRRRMLAELEESAGRILEHYSSAVLLFAQNSHSLVADVESALISLFGSTGEAFYQLATVPADAAHLLNQSRETLLGNACDGTASSDENLSASECITIVDEVLAELLKTDGKTNVTAKALEACISAIKKAAGAFSDAAFHVAPNIPHGNLETALSTYGYGIAPKDVLCLHDTTWFSATDGFLITPELFAWHNDGEDYKRIPISDIRTVETIKGYEYSFFINGEPVSISTSDNEKARSVFVKVVNAVRKPGADQENPRLSNRSAPIAAGAASNSATGTAAISSLIAQGREHSRVSSFDMAKSFFVQAAELGSAEAMEEMANIWSMGLGCAKDPVAAERWRKQAQKARRERNAAGTQAAGIDASLTKAQLLDSMTKAQLGDLAKAVGVSLSNSRITKSEMIDRLLAKKELTKARLLDALRR